MPSYPDMRIDPDKARDEPTKEAETFYDGAGKAKVYWPESAKRFTFTHHAVDQAAVEEILAFWAANKTTPFDFVWPLDGQTYSVLFAERPLATAVGKEAPSLRNVEIILVEA